MGRHTVSLMQLGENIARPEEGMSNREWRETMMRSIRSIVEGGLTERQRDCVMLYYFGGLTVQKAAEELGLNKSTVSRHLAAARRKISRILSCRGAY